MLRSTSATLFLGFVQSKTVSPRAPRIWAKWEPVAARRQLRIFGKDLRCLYKFSTAQSVRVQAARRGKDDPPGVLCPRQRAVLAFEDKNSLPNPCLSTCPLLHGAKPVQYKIPSDRSSRKRPKRSPFQMSGTTNANINC